MLNIGFYYHSNFKKVNNQIVVPGYIGVFIDALALQVKKLYLFLEEQTDLTSVEEDYVLNKSNITLVSLGRKSTFYHRLLYPKRQLRILEQHIPQIDLFLQRIPTPLAPHFYSVLKKHNKPCYSLVVGDYVKSLGGMTQPPIRKQVIITLTHYYQWLQNKMIRQSKVLVNSIELLNDYKDKSKGITLIKTTTLNAESFYERVDTCTKDEIRILYTGRINYQKGLRELVDAVAELVNTSKMDLKIDIVGWEESGTYNYEENLKLRAKEKGIGDRIFFHGKKKVGIELDLFYRNADIYVIPSYQEGFPRTIWEAMANSLPVIATSVGSIPMFLTENEISIIPPQNTKALRDEIKKIVTDKQLRQSKIKQAFVYAKECTLEKQTALLVETIEKYSKEK